NSFKKTEQTEPAARHQECISFNGEPIFNPAFLQILIKLSSDIALHSPSSSASSTLAFQGISSLSHSFQARQSSIFDHAFRRSCIHKRVSRGSSCTSH